MTFGDLKKDLVKAILEHPSLYKGEYWVFDILTIDYISDNHTVFAEYTLWEYDNDLNPIHKLVNYELMDV